jgi:hypothetical protein
MLWPRCCRWLRAKCGDCSSPQAQIGSPVSGIQGSDPFPAMSYLAKRMGVLAMRVCCTPDRAEYPQQSGKCMHLSLLAVARLATAAPSALPMMMAGSFTSQASAIHSSRSSATLSDASAIASPVTCCATTFDTLELSCHRRVSARRCRDARGSFATLGGQPTRRRGPLRAARVGRV